MDIEVCYDLSVYALICFAAMKKPAPESMAVTEPIPAARPISPNIMEDRNKPITPMRINKMAMILMFIPPRKLKSPSFFICIYSHYKNNSLTIAGRAYVCAVLPGQDGGTGKIS